MAELPIRTLRDVRAGEQPVYTPKHAVGAWRNNTRVRKVRNDPGDTHTVGDQAVILGSIGPGPDGQYFYFVEWDDLPGIPVGIQSSKLAPL